MQYHHPAHRLILMVLEGNLKLIFLLLAHKEKKKWKTHYYITYFEIARFFYCKRAKRN
jgi:hypothetical protein